MTVVLGIVTFFLILAVLILVHEFGHFVFAKLMGVRVEEFGLGFPPRLKSIRRGETLYSLNAIPIGGFVRMVGENGEDASPDSFGAKAPWQRFVILVAGPSMNLVLAIAIFFVYFLQGAPHRLAVVTAVARNSPAARAGLEGGDRILAIDGHGVSYAENLVTFTQSHLGQKVVVLVERGQDVFSVGLVPRKKPPAGQGAMGIVLGKVDVVPMGPGESLGKAVQQLGLMVATLPTVVQSVSQHGGSDLQGPIGIARDTTDVVQNAPSDGGFNSILGLVALLSVNLGVLNLLPIPALDGGRIFFVLVAWVRRRNLDPQLEGVIHLAGMAVLLFLIVLISYQDVIRWVSGGSGG